MAQPLMQSTDNRAVLDRYYAVLDRRDPSGFADVISPDIVFVDDALRRADVRGIDAFAGVMAVMWQAFPDLTFTVLTGPFLGDDDARAMVHIRLTGTMSEALPAMGLTKVGGKMDVDGIALYEFRDNRIVHARFCCDPGVVAEQLGSQ